MKYIQKGFTLVEMMVIVALVSVLLILTMTSVKKQKITSRNNVRISDIKLMRLALEDYKLTCGQYPPRFELNAHSNSGPCSAASGITLGDFISDIPVNPNHPNPQWDSYVASSGINGSNGYLYAGLSSSPISGKCYDYHIAAELEMLGQDMAILDTDHDAQRGTGKFSHRCGGSNPDFSLGEQEDVGGMYDFRNTNSI
ncbi:MAG: prepilin-type N-terminal cleavage/methylation domain-containing protein [Candidatus Pacebacteria bacterium]|nr:prepilin-type N-terminal cleavage/methylation domain-containing protein [Candidatus Paceibacterota bacterium]